MYHTHLEMVQQSTGMMSYCHLEPAKKHTQPFSQNLTGLHAPLHAVHPLEFPMHS